MAKIKLRWREKCLGEIEYSAIQENQTKEGYIWIDFSKWPTLDNQIRCHLKYDPTKHTFEKFDKIVKANNSQEIVRIAFIVESPHRDEFDENFNPLEPLNGKAGTVFNNKICTKMNGWFQNACDRKIYEIKIFNPVPYQTSLYHFLNDKIDGMKLSDQLKKGVTIPWYNKLNGKIRDAVWANLFYSEDACCMPLFLGDIIRYWPDYIVNCCTGVSKDRISSNWESLTSKRGSLLKYLLTSQKQCTLNMAVEDALTKLDDCILQAMRYRIDDYPYGSRWN